MPQPVAIAVMALIAVLLLGAMSIGWRGRSRRSAELVPTPLPAAPADPGTARSAAVPAIYVTTTTGGDRYERVAAHDLGARSAATVQVTDSGVLIARTGARDVFVPAGDLVAVGTSAGMVGKYVGGEGLVVLRWRLGDQVLDTGLRLRHSADHTALQTAARSLLPADSTSDDETRVDSTSDDSTADNSTTDNRGHE